MNNIDKIFIINLDKDIDRLNNSYKQLNNYNITNYERYPAIYAAEANKYELNTYTTTIGKIIASKTMIGCGISHINIWKKIVKEKINTSLIVEDDFILVDDFLNKFNIIINKAPNEYDILFLSSDQMHNPSIKIRDINEYFYKQIFISQTIGYIITLKGAEKILKYIYKVSYHIDFQIFMTSLFTDLDVISVKERLIYQTFETSNNLNDRNYPLIIDNLLMNNKLNYFYKLVFLSIKSLEININVIIIFLLGFYLFPYGFILLILEYLYKPNDLFLGNLSILIVGYIIRLTYLNIIDE
jgi:GR25 family glycosyltransferase involved in LPS biosynthesis